MTRRPVPRAPVIVLGAGRFRSFLARTETSAVSNMVTAWSSARWAVATASDHGEVGFRRSAFKAVPTPERGWLDVDTEMLRDPERDHWVILYAVRTTSS